MSDDRLKKIEDELKRLNKNVEEIIIPLLNHILKVDVKITPEKRDVIKDLISKISKQ